MKLDLSSLSNISNREKRILLMFFGVLLLVVSYVAVFSPQMDAASEVAMQNDSLNDRLNERKW